MFKDFFLGFIKIHILYHAGKEPVYGTGIMEELGRHGYKIGPGTLYPILHKLEKEEYLKRSDRVVKGKVRKYYSITPKGEEALREIKEKILELVNEVVYEQ
ncbi:MAG: PadR family transcriptional regulator [Candidatus Eremiobacterota bacterium]